MNFRAASGRGRGILMDFLFFISPQAAGINPKRLKKNQKEKGQ